MTIVRHIHIGEARPPLTDEEFAELCTLAEANSIPDCEIDFSDMPEMSEERLAGMIPGEEAMRRWRERQKTKKAVAVT
jgi:hypothetical protein